MIEDFLDNIFNTSETSGQKVMLFLGPSYSLHGRVIRWTDEQVLIERAFVDGSPNEVAVNRSYISHGFLVPDED